MFVYSIRASSVKFFAFILFSLVILSALVMSGNDSAVYASSDGYVDYSGIKSEDDRVAFIERFGIKVEREGREEMNFAMPENFDRVILGYNELQKKQGLNLSKYARKKVTRYTYKVTNYDAEGEVYASLFVHRGRIIACDLSSASPDGFVLPLTLVDREKLK